MPKASIIRTKDGKRYIKIAGKKRIKVDSRMTERELIKWLIKYLKPRRRRKKKEEAEMKVKMPLGKTGEAIMISDAAKIEARKEKEEAEKLAKKLIEEKADTEKLRRQLKDEREERARLPPGAEHGRPAIGPGRRMIEVAEEDAEEIARMYGEMQREKERAEEKQRREAEARRAAEEKHRKEEEARRVAEEKHQKEKKERSIAEIMRERAEIATQIIKNKKESEELRKRKEIWLAKAIAAEDTLPKLRDRINKYNEEHPTKPLQSSEGGSFRMTGKQGKELKDEIKANKIIAEQLEPGRLKRELQAKEEYQKMRNELLAIDANTKALEDKDKDLDRQLKEMAGKGRPTDTNVYDNGLFEWQIDGLMHQEPDYLGTIASDEIPTLIPKLQGRRRVCFVMNTDPRSKPGEHWVCFYIDDRPHGTHSVEYYDPLADSFTKLAPNVMPDLKDLVKAIQGDEDRYLKFRVNKVADQNDISKNCGEFCVHFLLQRLRGHSFAEASGWNARGEHNIELWKKHRPQRYWISGQRGEGLRDIYEKVRSHATRIIKRIKDTLGGPRSGAPPAVRGWLEKYGQEEIKSIAVCKKPIFSMLETIGNWVTNGELERRKRELGYEKLMHLFMIIEIPSGLFKIEKNQVVEIKRSSDLGREYLHLPNQKFGTANQRFQAAEKAHGKELWQYHLVTANCQKFVLWFLGPFVTPEIRAFVEQDIEKTLQGMGLIQKIATAATDLAATADVALNGAGHMQ